MQPIYKTLTALILLIITIVGLFVWRMTSPLFIDKEALREEGIFLFPEPRPAPELNLIDDEGKPFTNEQLKGKWSFIFFGFTSCGEVCPTSLSELSRIQQAMVQKEGQPPLQYIFFSIDPKRDTPQRIKEYVTTFNKNFVGVTTLEKNLPAIGSALNVIVDIPKMHQHDHDAHDHHATPEPQTEIDHSANIVIINPNGQYHGFIRGGFKADQVIPYMRAVLQSM